jgi:large subunit ribosomal protein L9
MEVILTRDIPKLGHKNEIINVKPGYGRNYLVPQGMAIAASVSAKKVLAENLKQRAHKETKIKNEALELASKLEGVSLTIGTKASATGKIFGSVTTIQVADALAKSGYSIDRKSICLKDSSIKELGSYSAQVVLYKGVEVEVKFEVVAE